MNYNHLTAKELIRYLGRMRASLDRSARCAPATAPGITPTASPKAMDQSTLPSTACVTVPGTAMIATVMSDVPTARFTENPVHRVSMGTSTKPPPRPKKPKTWKQRLPD